MKSLRPYRTVPRGLVFKLSIVQQEPGVDQRLISVVIRECSIHRFERNAIRVGRIRGVPIHPAQVTNQCPDMHAVLQNARLRAALAMWSRDDVRGDELILGNLTLNHIVTFAIRCDAGETLATYSTPSLVFRLQPLVQARIVSMCFGVSPVSGRPTRGARSRCITAPAQT
jgi:hypothetical protein